MMLSKLVRFSSLSLLCFGCASVFAQTETQEAPTLAQPALTPQQVADLKDSAAEAQQWLKLVDEGKYGESWDTGSNIFRFTIKRDEWIKSQEKIHKPYGQLVSRELVQQAPAENPKGLPAGDYMVLVYKSSFSNHPTANELVTMVRSTDGKWKVLTYQASY